MDHVGTSFLLPLQDDEKTMHPILLFNDLLQSYYSKLFLPKLPVLVSYLHLDMSPSWLVIVKQKKKKI